MCRIMLSTLLFIFAFSLENSFATSPAVIVINTSNEKAAQASLQTVTADILKEKNKSQAQARAVSFLSSLENQKADLFAQLQRSAPQDPTSRGTVTYQNLQKQYELLLEVYISFESLKAGLADGSALQNCAKFEHDYSMSVSTSDSKNKYNFYQTKVLEIHKHLCQ